MAPLQIRKKHLFLQVNEAICQAHGLSGEGVSAAPASLASVFTQSPSCTSVRGSLMLDSNFVLFNPPSCPTRQALFLHFIPKTQAARGKGTCPRAPRVIGDTRKGTPGFQEPRTQVLTLIRHGKATGVFSVSSLFPPRPPRPTAPFGELCAISRARTAAGSRQHTPRQSKRTEISLKTTA